MNMPQEYSPSDSMSKHRLRMLVAAGVAITGFPIWLTAAAVLDHDGQRPDPTGNWDAIVVAGCLVMPDGRPSLALVRRTEKAVQLWRAGRAPLIVLTGGVGQGPIAEAQAAARVARSLGVPEQQLILEQDSKNTEQNARFTRKLIDGDRLIVVTDTYHVRRCEWFFRKYFRTVTGVGVISPLVPRATGAFRESIAFAYYAIRGIEERG